jgi:hypothetical protein
MDNPTRPGNGDVPGRWWLAQRRDLTVGRFFGYVLAVGLAAAVALILLTRNDTPRPAGPPPGVHDGRADMRRAAEAGVRLTAKDPDAVRFRGEQVYTQAVAGQVAVCGQTNVFGGASQSFVPFVALIGVNTGIEAPAQKYQVVDIHVASTPGEADHTYLQTVARCYDGGGPQIHAGVTPVPPLPEHLNAAQRAAAAPSAPPDRADATRPPAVAQPVANVARTVGAPMPDWRPPSGGAAEAGAVAAATSRTVTMRQNGNIRSAPHGDTIRVAPKGTSMHVFAEAPGGWLEVGDATAPFGWVHGSMVEH